MKMTNSLAINLVGVGKKYRSVIAVDKVDLSLASRECIALVGHNGAGKSTLIKMMLGLVKPSFGELSILNCDPFERDFADVRRGIGFLPEQVLFQKNMTGLETLIFYAKLKKLRDVNFPELFARVGLDNAADRKVGTYSKGMRQKLGMAQALMGQPKLLVLDEPTSGLDPMARQNVYKIIDEEKTRGATVLISSHALTELDERIDRVVILKDGKVVASGSIAFLRKTLGMHAKIKLSAELKVCEQIERSLAGKYQLEKPADGKLVISSPLDMKAVVLSQIMALGLEISDVEISEPTLESVYNSYSSSVVGRNSDD